MKIWCIESCKLTSLLLRRLEQDKFRVVQPGEMSSLLTNADYVLMDKKFKRAIESLIGQIETQDVIIYDKVKDETRDNYFEVKILNEITQDSINHLDSRGPKIWTFGNIAIFVSDDLKNQIRRIEMDEFEFTEGFSHFAGA